MRPQADPRPENVCPSLSFSHPEVCRHRLMGHIALAQLRRMTSDTPRDQGREKPTVFKCLKHGAVHSPYSNHISAGQFDHLKLITKTALALSGVHTCVMLLSLGDKCSHGGSIQFNEILFNKVKATGSACLDRSRHCSPLRLEQLLVAFL